MADLSRPFENQERANGTSTAMPVRNRKRLGQGAAQRKPSDLCKDCQAFAYFLGQENQFLDERGGSDVIQILPQNLSFTQGIEAFFLKGTPIVAPRVLSSAERADLMAR